MYAKLWQVFQGQFEVNLYAHLIERNFVANWVNQKSAKMS